MANIIEILIKARDEASKVLDKTGSSAKGMATGLNSVVKGMTGLDLATVGFAGAAVYAAKTIAAWTAETQNYNLQMIDMARYMGTTTEEASQLFQMADDLRLETSTLTMAFREMTTDGMQPTIEGLAGLAGEYEDITDPVEKARFAVEKFGARSGPEMKKLLELGEDGVAQLAKGIGDGLIVTEEAARASEEYYKAVDNLTDSWLAFKYTIGNSIIPVITDIIDGNKETTKYIKDQISILEVGIARQKQYGQSTEASEKQLKYWQDRLMAARDAQYDMNKSQQEGSETVYAYAKSLDDMKLVLDGAYGEMQTKYTDSQEKLNVKAQEYLDKINELSVLPWLTDDQKKDLDDAKKGWEETTSSIKDAEKAHDKETKKFVVDMLIKRLSLDEFSTADGEFIDSLMIKWGLVDQQTADLISSADAYNDMLNTGAIKASDLASQITGIPDKTVTVTVNAVGNGVQYLGGSSGSKHITASDTTRTYALAGGRASGGKVKKGVPYLVGELGPEPFIPDQNGTILPHGSSIGGNITIVYSPQASFATQEELRRNLVPLVRQAMRGTI